MVVQNQALVRRALKYVVQEGLPGAEIVEAEDAGAALEIMRSAPADIALLDVRTPDFDGLELLRAMKLELPEVQVIMLSTNEDTANMKRALADGAAGYLWSDTTPEDLAQAINVALSGRASVLSPRVIQNLFEDVESTGPSGLTKDSGQRLTRREYDVLELLVEGKSNRGIAQGLFLSEKTVKAHLASIFVKLGVANRTQAAMTAVQMGVAPPHGSPTASSSD
jgi:DNA-binding NarL/FixJ family response regulator